MSAPVGIELGRNTLRAVQAARLPGRAPRTAEAPWDPRHPAEGIAALEAVLGRPASLRLAVGASFLMVTRPQLPPVPAAARARIVALAPERHFADSATPLVTAWAEEAGLAFASDRALVAGWLEAFSAWAPVESIEPAPSALARALRSAGAGDYRDEADGALMLVTVGNGRLQGARLPGMTWPAAQARPVPDLDVPARFATARGGLSRPDADGHELLAPPEWSAAWAARDRRRLAAGIALVAAGIAVLAWGADRSRERVLAALESRAATLAAQADSEALAMLRSREAELALVRLREARPDPLGALAALGLALPGDAVVRSARADGDEWQVEGIAADAAAIVPRLDRDGRFDGVRVLAASTRFREGNRTRETFSIAFRYRPQP